MQARDLKRIVRALEVYLLTGRALSDHFAATTPALPEYEVMAYALAIPPEETAERVARRVDAQFEQGLLDEIRGLLASGIPETAPLHRAGVQQALEHLHGLRGDRETRELIVRENRRYSRRQLIWFRKEPNLRWIHAAGQREETLEEVARALAAMESSPNGPASVSRVPPAAAQHSGRLPELRASRKAARAHPTDGRDGLRGPRQELRSLRGHRRAQRRRSHGVQACDRDDSFSRTMGNYYSTHEPEPPVPSDRPRRVILVLDSVGIGELPDADRYGDRGSNTLGNIAKAVPLALPLRSLGLGRVVDIGAGGDPSPAAPMAGWRRRRPEGFGHRALGADGARARSGVPVFPRGFPAELIVEFERRIGRKVLGNKSPPAPPSSTSSGRSTWKPASQSSTPPPDSVFQIAAHEDVIPVPELYRICEIAYELVAGAGGRPCDRAAVHRRARRVQAHGEPA